MIGQHKLQKQVYEMIDNQKFPHTVLLVGDVGCGKHTLCSEIAKRLKINLVDLTDNLDQETIESVILSPTPNLYIIDGSLISVREQNMILKFLEEPLKNSYIVLLVESKQRLLQTVINRCYCLYFEGYSKEDLELFLSVDNELVLDYANTPGRVIEFQKHNLESMIELADKIFLKLQNANYSNILTIPDKLSFSNDSDDKFDFSVFSYILLMRCFYLYNDNCIPYKAYESTSRFYNNLLIPNINRKQLFEHFIFELKQVLK